MKFYRYWTTATRRGIDPDGDEVFRSAAGYSNHSLEDALKIAKQQADALGDFWSDPNRIWREGGGYYGQGNRPIREQIIDELNEGDDRYAVISRNAYGCLVLNTESVFFADVDISSPSLTERLFGLFTKKKPTFEANLVEKISKIIERDSRICIRLYRTLRGYRIAIMDRLIDPEDAQSDSLLKELGSDKLYVSLCRSQDCYRARLTPKPWRCGSTKPPTRFPFTYPGTEERFQKWLIEYEKTSQQFATCALVGEFGSTTKHPRAQSVLDLHDRFVLNDQRPLA